MELKRVTSPGDPLFDRIFGLYEVSFPVHEQRTRDKQVKVLSQPAYHCEAVLEDGRFVGLLLMWETERFFYVEHFAIAPELRGRNFGSRALELLGQRGKAVVLEIDPLVDEVALRRQRFYEHIGFHTNPWPHVHPPYRPGFAGHPLVVMTYPEPWDEGRYQEFSVYLQKTVMADCQNVGSET